MSSSPTATSSADFLAQYLRAREVQAELMVDEILDLADDTFTPLRRTWLVTVIRDPTNSQSKCERWMRIARGPA